jgi:hypothetical protein
VLKHLQNFGFRDSPYDRPNQKWLCGHLAEGYECAIGPDGRGRCQATAECLPTKRGDRWHCARAQQHGGRCGEGPGPDGGCGRPIETCQPVLSIAAKRSATVRWAIAAAIGLVLLAAGGEWSTRFVVPGALTFQHGDVGECQDCHSVKDHGPIGWLSAALRPDSSLIDSKLCLDCHLLGEDALTAHSLTPSTLRNGETTEVAESRAAPRPVLLSLANLITRPPEANEQVPCGTCHREHQGRRFNLSEMGNLRCQSCHGTQFQSFADGHPEFADFPYRRRTRLAFDHASHIGKHFKEQKDVEAPTRCTGCHMPDPAGLAMLVKPFEVACEACHLTQILGDSRSGPKGYPVIGLPGFDLRTLYENGREIGEWPRDADGKIAPLTSLLLSVDPSHADDLFTLTGLDLMDLRGASDDELAAVERVVWSLKQLIYDLTTGGHGTFQDRLSAALDTTLAERDVAHLMGTMPVDALAMLQREWLPQLADEIAAREAGRTIPSPLWAQQFLAPPQNNEATPPAPNETDDTDSLVPSDGLHDDDGLLDGGLLEDGGLLDGSDADQGLLGDDDLLPDDGGLLTSDGDLLPGDDHDLVADDGGLLSDDGDLLSGGNDLVADDGGLLSDDGDLLSGDDDLLSSQDDTGLLGEDAPPADDGSILIDTLPAPRSELAMDVLDAESWMRSGGWYRQNFTLYYRPIGHADTFLRGWIDLTATVGPSPGAGQALEIFADLTGRRAPGACGKCHSVDSDADNTLTVNWGPKLRTEEVHRFTEYRHSPHFSLLDETGCLTCHVIDYGADFMASFEDVDAAAFASNFKPMNKKTCAACHVESLAGDACIDCHNYHIGRFPPPLNFAPLTAKVSETEAAKPE